ncbi:hypothetical protein [Magnetospirillum sp. 64-120]|uniref:hypothetical protein n=1 Tax=Magnetospirillum sp. 64-120 TaxID=1895778 RepID=UPI0025BB6CB2|nr:hypothetical protein [Magnetospirillum sp. 64-120]
MIEQFLEFILPKETWEKIDAAIPKAERKRLLLLLCAVAFVYASFSAYDDVNKRLRIAQERNHPPTVPFETPPLPLSTKALTSEQAKTISSLAAENRLKIGKLYFARYLHKDTVMYSEAILDALKRSGLDITEDAISPDDPKQTGVMVACDNPEKLPDSALAIMDVFRKADIEITTTEMLSQARNNGAKGCILFIGPDPF